MGCTPQPAGLLEVSAPCPPSNMPSVPRTAQPRIPASPAARSLRLTASRFPPDPAPRPSQMDGQGQGPGGLTLSHLRPRRDLGQVPRFPLRGAARLESGARLLQPFLPRPSRRAPRQPHPYAPGVGAPRAARPSPRRRSFTPRALGGRDSRTRPALRARGRPAGRRGFTPLTQRAQDGGVVVVGGGGSGGGGGRGGSGDDSRDGGGGAGPGTRGMRRPRRASGGAV